MNDHLIAAIELDFPDQVDGKELIGRYRPPEISLEEFTREAWDVLEPGVSLQWSWLHKLTLEYLEAGWRGQLSKPNLLLNQPPRHLKSVLSSVIFPCWVWSQEPWSTFLCLSYATSLAIDHNSNRRTLIQSDWYQELTGGQIRLQLGKNRLSEFGNNYRGYMLARGLDGAVTGVGAGTAIIVDDPENPEKKESPEVRARQQQRLRSYLANRKNRPETPILIIQQRCDRSDTSSWVISSQQDSYEVVIAPQVATEDERYILPISGSEVRRSVGEVIDPSRYPLDQVLKDKETMGAAVFAARQQQDPIPSEGSIIQWASFKRFPLQSVRWDEDFKLKLLSIDAASTKSSTSSHWAFIFAGLTWEDQIQILSITRKRLRYPEGKAMLRHLAEEFEPNLIIIENKSSGIQLGQECTELPLLLVNPESDKATRMELESTQIQGGLVWVPSDDLPWIKEFEVEVKSFPDGANDQIDALSQLLKWVRLNKRPKRIPQSTIRDPRIEAKKPKLFVTGKGVDNINRIE